MPRSCKSVRPWIWCKTSPVRAPRLPCQHSPMCDLFYRLLIFYKRVTMTMRSCK